MKDKDSTVTKILTELGLRGEQQLSPEQEEILARALDEKENFYHNVEQLFKGANNGGDN